MDNRVDPIWKTYRNTHIFRGYPDSGQLYEETRVNFGQHERSTNEKLWITYGQLVSTKRKLFSFPGLSRFGKLTIKDTLDNNGKLWITYEQLLSTKWKIQGFPKLPSFCQLMVREPGQQRAT